MVADYDRFSPQFKKSRELPFRTYIEEFMVLQMLGNVAGLTALDLACGEGHYAADASSPRGGASHRGRHLGRNDRAGEGRGRRASRSGSIM